MQTVASIKWMGKPLWAAELCLWIYVNLWPQAMHSILLPWEDKCCYLLGVYSTLCVFWYYWWNTKWLDTRLTGKNKNKNPWPNRHAYLVWMINAAQTFEFYKWHYGASAELQRWPYGVKMVCLHNRDVLRPFIGIHRGGPKVDEILVVCLAIMSIALKSNSSSLWSDSGPSYKKKNDPTPTPAIFIGKKSFHWGKWDLFFQCKYQAWGGLSWIGTVKWGKRLRPLSQHHSPNPNWVPHACYLSFK